MSEITRYRNLVKAVNQAMDGGSQTSLAKVLGTKQPVISDWLSGKSFPGEYLRRKLAKLQGMTLDQFDAVLDGADVSVLKLPQTAEEAAPLLQELDREERIRLARMLLD